MVDAPQLRKPYMAGYDFRNAQALGRSERSSSEICFVMKRRDKIQKDGGLSLLQVIAG